MGRIQADVSKPGTDDVDLDTGLQQVDRSGMAPRVGTDGVTDPLLAPEAMATNNLVDSEPRERPSGRGDEHRLIDVVDTLGDEFAQPTGGKCPQRTDPPLVAFAVETNPRVGPQVEVTDTQVGDFLDPRAGVVEKHQERVVAQGSRSARRKPLEQGLDLVTLQESRAWGWRPLRGHGTQALRLGQKLRHAFGRVFEQAA